MKKVLSIIGVGIFVGAVAYVLWNKAFSTKEDVVASPEKKPTYITPENDVSVVSNNICEIKDKLNDLKNSSINTMSTRHEDASKIMKDAVEIICKRSEISENENRDLEQISNELDELLCEE